MTKLLADVDAQRAPTSTVATTLRVYAAGVAASDRKAAELLGSRMPKRPAKAPTSGDGDG